MFSKTKERNNIFQKHSLEVVLQFFKLWCKKSHLKQKLILMISLIFYSFWSAIFQNRTRKLFCRTGHESYVKNRSNHLEELFKTMLSVKEPFAGFLQKIRCSEKFNKFHMKRHILECPYSKIAGRQPNNIIEKRLQHRCFPMKFTKSLRKLFIQNTFGGFFWLSWKLCKILT